MTISLDYIAGFFDGEGCIQIGIKECDSVKYGYQFRVRLFLGQSSREVLDQIQHFLGYGRISKRVATGRFVHAGTITIREYQYEMYNLDINRRDNVMAFLLSVQEKLVVKRRQAEIALEALSLLPHGRLSPINAFPKRDALHVVELIAKMRSLNGHSGKHTIDLSAITASIEVYDEEFYFRRLEQNRVNIATRARQSHNLERWRIKQKALKSGQGPVSPPGITLC